MILSTVNLLLIGALALLFLSAALAPLESLGWWAGWFGDKQAPPLPNRLPAEGAPAPESPDGHFLVYLSGIGAIDHHSIPQEEIDWGRMLIRRLPGTTVCAEVYPYSVTNVGLSAQRFFSGMWQYLERRRLDNPSDVFQYLINTRNMFQVAISADRRYGPIYNLGVANAIVEALQQRGYRLGSGKPVTLLGFSGGGQIAIGTATFLKPILRAPLRVISIGGVMSDDVGLNQLDKLYHLWGHLDPLHGLGATLYAGRWSWFPNSDWNRALAAGKIIFVDMGQMHHNGSTNYFSWTAFTPDGRSHALATIDQIGELLVKEGLIDPAALAEAQAATRAEAQAYEQARVDEATAAQRAKAGRRAA